VEPGRSLGAGFGQRSLHTIRVEVRRVHRRSGLLPPRLVEPAGVDRVEAEILHEPHHHSLGARVIPRDRKRDPAPRPLRLVPRSQTLSPNVVEGLHDRSAQSIRDPAALGLPALDLLNQAVTMSGVVVPGIRHDDIPGNAVEQSLRQIADAPFGNGHDDDVAREFAIETSWSSCVRRRARVPPMLPAPMIPILIAPFCLSSAIDR
jgi:hypothetical protein